MRIPRIPVFMGSVNLPCSVRCAAVRDERSAPYWTKVLDDVLKAAFLPAACAVCGFGGAVPVAKGVVLVGD